MYEVCRRSEKGAADKDSGEGSEMRRSKMLRDGIEMHRGWELIGVDRRKEGGTQAANKTNFPGHWGSEKYGTWMLVSRKERRSRNRRMNPQMESPPINNRQDTRRNTGLEGLGTQSRFAALENLDDTPGQDQEMAGAMNLQQPESSLPRIRMNDLNKQRSPVQREVSTHQERSGLDQGLQNQPAYHNGYQNSVRGDYQPAYRGGHQNTYRGGYQYDVQGGYQATFRGGSQGANRAMEEGDGLGEPVEVVADGRHQRS
nr:NFX1-type zinc finger-containing protein 1-like [Ipomoea batatas]